MAKKFMKNLMVMMLMELIIFETVEVQANDLLPLSFYKSSHPRPLHARELRSGQNEPEPTEGPLLRCLETKVDECKAKHDIESTKFMTCIIGHFIKCFSEHQRRREGRDKEVFDLGKMCMELCFSDPAPTIQSAICLLRCYEKHIKPLKFKVCLKFPNYYLLF